VCVCVCVCVCVLENLKHENILDLDFFVCLFICFFFFFFFLCFSRQDFSVQPWLPGTHSVDYAGPKLTEIYLPL
jgi:hypothetical protein